MHFGIVSLFFMLLLFSSFFRINGCTDLLLSLLVFLSRGQAWHKQQINRWLLTTWMALTPLSYWRLKKFHVVSSPISPFAVLQWLHHFLSRLGRFVSTQVSPYSPFHTPHWHFYAYYQPSLLVSLYFSLLFQKNPSRGKKNHWHMSLWTLNPLIPWTCDLVIRCDWRIKKQNTS